MLVASCVASPSESSVSPTTSIEAYLAQLENDDSLSGVVMVAKDFVPFATKATGYADRARGAPNATITPFNIASITKIFTAVAIGQLVDQGKVSLEDPLTKYLPTYPRTPGDQITIAMLISQTAGTGNYRDDAGYLRVRDSFESISALLGAVNTAVTPGAVPGKTFSFSDTGYLLLGAVIERASGQDYYDYMDNEVFAKAGVAAGFLRNTDDELSDRGFALGYTADGSKNWSSLPVRGTPASGAYATAPDLLSFHKALATGALVKLETLKRLVLLPPPSRQTSPGLTSGVFAGNDNGASAVIADVGPHGLLIRCPRDHHRARSRSGRRRPAGPGDAAARGDNGRERDSDDASLHVARTTAASASSRGRSSGTLWPASSSMSRPSASVWTIRRATFSDRTFERVPRTTRVGQAIDASASQRSSAGMRPLMIRRSAPASERQTNPPSSSRNANASRFS